MIIIQLAGGLGNQMFQYALYLQLKSLGKEVKIDDVAGFAQDAQRDPALMPFGIDYERPTAEELREMLDSSMMPWSRVRRKLFGRKKRSYFEADKRYHPEVMEWDDIYLEGYWQTEKYFEGVSEAVKAAYDTDWLLQYVRQQERASARSIEQNARAETGRSIEHNAGAESGRSIMQNTGTESGQSIEQNVDLKSCGNLYSNTEKTHDAQAELPQRTVDEWLTKITSTESVSVHIRRGDYLLPENQRLFGGICTEAYYRNAMMQVKKEHPNCTFYLFTNDKEWAGEWIATGLNADKKTNSAATVSTELRTEDIEIINLSRHSDYAEFVLMSRCRHHILANSSFSWWASYLNRNPEKTVFAPAKWLNGWDCEDIYRADMRRI
ncbi:MAG: alpha-1,2-fucosyltransferase [Lachnospiraceae bacterium]|nr:alpha-1,2-fucosyltransferase [Lachnospiraceae bacterium]